MTSTNLTIVQQGGAVPVMSSVKGVSYDELVKRMEEEEAFASMFPGDEYSFKKGHWIKGWGDNKEVVDQVFRDKSIIINAANVNFGWRMFVDNGEKKKPVYLAFANPALGEKLPERKSLGHNDKSLWEVVEYQGKAKEQDPIQKIAMVPFRFDGDTKVHHLMIQSWSAVRVVQDFMKTFGMEGRKHIGKLPVVNLDVKLEEHWDDPTVTFDVPVFKIVDWEFPIAEDEPPGSVSISSDVKATAQIPTDGGVTSSARVAQSSAKTVEKIKEEALKGVENGGEPTVWGDEEPEKVLETAGATNGGIGGGRRGAKSTSSRRGG